MKTILWHSEIKVDILCRSLDKDDSFWRAWGQLEVYIFFLLLCEYSVMEMKNNRGEYISIQHSRYVSSCKFNVSSQNLFDDLKTSTIYSSCHKKMWYFKYTHKESNNLKSQHNISILKETFFYCIGHWR